MGGRSGWWHRGKHRGAQRGPPLGWQSCRGSLWDILSLWIPIPIAATELRLAFSQGNLLLRVVCSQGRLPVSSESCCRSSQPWKKTRQPRRCSWDTDCSRLQLLWRTKSLICDPDKQTVMLLGGWTEMNSAAHWNFIASHKLSHCLWNQTLWGAGMWHKRRWPRKCKVQMSLHLREYFFTDFFSFFKMNFKLWEFLQTTVRDRERETRQLLPTRCECAKFPNNIAKELDNTRASEQS